MFVAVRCLVVLVALLLAAPAEAQDSDRCRDLVWSSASGRGTFTIAPGASCRVSVFVGARTVVDRIRIVEQARQGRAGVAGRTNVRFVASPGARGSDTFVMRVDHETGGRRGWYPVRFTVTYR